jgi:hypothetical protein
MDFIRVYFNAEKAESVFFVLGGMLAIVISVYCWISVKKPFYSGLAFPLIFVGIIQVTAGTLLYLRSPRDTERVLNYMTLEPERIQLEEIPRMETVLQRFTYYKYLELAFILLGLILMCFPQTSDLIKGIGLGLFVQGAVMLGADYVAEYRAHEYLRMLHKQAPALYKQS